jgi:hypothetical protein
MLEDRKSRSAEPARKTTETSVKTAASVPSGGGCRAVEQTLGSRAGPALLEPRPCEEEPKTAAGKSTPPKNGFGTRVSPKTTTSSGGIRLSAPISPPVPVRRRAAGPEVGLVRAPLPDGLTWISPSRAISTVATASPSPRPSAQRVAGPRRCTDDVVLAAQRPRELRMVCADDQVRGDRRGKQEACAMNTRLANSGPPVNSPSQMRCR